MTAKGTPCKTCCCNDCQARLPINLRCCCSCFCERLCVTIALDSTGTAATDCDCILLQVPMIYDCATNSWHGDISCGKLTVDLKFEIKTCDDKCYICLTSTCLGLTGACPGDCLEFSPGAAFCNSLVNTANDLWSVDFTSCNDGEGTSVCGAGTVSIICEDRIDPFGCPATGTGADLRCEDCVCPGCECTCRCLCVDFNDDDCSAPQGCPTAQENQVCYDRETNSWHLTYECAGDTVDLEFKLLGVDCDTGTGTAPCEMILISDFYGISEADPTPNVAEGIVNPQGAICPDISHFWSFDVQPPGGRNVSIGIQCLRCSRCQETAECCADRVWPDQLTASLDVVSCNDPPFVCCGGSPTGTGAAAVGDGEIVLTFQGIERRGDQTGTGDEFSCAAKYTGSGTWCGQPASIVLYLCDKCATGFDPGTTLEIVLCASSPCTPPQDQCDCDNTVTCDPINHSFSFDIDVDGEICQMEVDIVE